MNKQEAGRLGGRPYALTIEDIRQQQLLGIEVRPDNTKEVIDTSSINNLKELKRLYKLCHRSNGNEIHEGLGVTSSLLAPEGEID